MAEKNIPKSPPREEHAGHGAPRWERIQEGHAPVKKGHAPAKMQGPPPLPPPQKTPGTENVGRPKPKQ